MELNFWLMVNLTLKYKIWSAGALEIQRQVYQNI